MCDLTPFLRDASAVDAYEEAGQPQKFEWRGNTYTNLHDPGKTTVDHRFQHGQGDELKVFCFAEDGSYVSGWARPGQATHFHPDRTEMDNLYEPLVEVDELLPSSFVVPLTLLMCNLIIPFRPQGARRGSVSLSMLTAQASLPNAQQMLT